MILLTHGWKTSMLSVFRRLSRDRYSRRALLQLGGLAPLGLALPEIFSRRASQVTASTENGKPAMPRGTAKSCILVNLFGGPSQLDTFDLKPDAPREIRGEFQPIQTAVPGLLLCEHFRELAKQTDKLTIVRSMHHRDSGHGSALYYTLTGRPHPNLGDPPPRPGDFPHFGSILAKKVAGRGPLPCAVTLPRLCRFVTQPHALAGQDGGFLGNPYKPWLVEADPSGMEFQIAGLEPAETTRLTDRQHLLTNLDPVPNAMNVFRERAFQMITASPARRAFDLTQEPSRLRDHYGRTPLGQGLLLARRLIEAGVQLVTVNWHNDKSEMGADPYWDTHKDIFPSLKERLIPPTDQGLSALLEDLDQRQLLAETLIVVLGEFGRSPKIGKEASFPNGRDHWPFVYSILLAGGGIRGGQVYGSSDRIAGFPKDNHVSPADLLATIYHSLGFAAAGEILDRENRPQALCTGRVIERLF
jgi:hypothetical protein